MIHPDIVGCDVSKHALDLYLAGASERIDNTPAACAALASRLCGRFVVFEATGGYDRALRDALAAANVRFARVNPGRARDFARAAGFLAKTDKVDARMLAAYGQALKPAADAKPDPVRERLGDLVKRRDQLVKMRAQERVRRSEAGVMGADVEDHLAWLDARIKRIDVAIAALCADEAPLKRAIGHLRTAPGVGRVTAAVLTALMPELGARSPKTIAALAGLAPLNADSGQMRGQRRIRGGRRRVREALYMAAVSAIRCNGRYGGFYRRLRDAGKAPKQAIVAVARKLLIALNAMVRDNAAFAT